MKIFGDERLLSLGIINGTATREPGNMRDFANQAKVYEKLGIPQPDVLTFKQVHGTKIIEVNNDEDFEFCKTHPEQEADAWLITRPRTGAAILTADCVPFFVWNEDGSAVGLGHSGWRGVVAKLPTLLTQSVKAKGEGKKIFAYAGPHIQQCCFEVKDDIVGKFAPSSVEERDGKLFVNLRNEIKLQMVAAGVDEQNLHMPCACTCHNKEMFFSFRRDGTKDCILSFIYKMK
ncbi:hypothetical protein Dip510_000940 [Elusimicrobium posterum]|uniref:polyphenol oxidase family protein n=1 Tax=Elusimicrobium posterum TaxID=3116653 RepID=UPI003C7528FB